MYDATKVPQREGFDYREHNKGRVDRGEEIVIFINTERGAAEYFFSWDHMQKYDSSLGLENKWCPCSFPLPYSVKPRPSIPTGLVTDKDGMRALHADLKEIANPDPDFQV